MIRLSVIIPGYNTREEWWRRCLNSVRKACGPNDEIICVDDGSVIPVRPEWVASDRDSRVRILRKENGGLAAARNAGMQLASGQYIAFVDSDDEVNVEVFMRSIVSLEMNKSDIVVYGVNVIWPDDGLQKIDAIREDANLGSPTANDILNLYNMCLFNYVCNKVYRYDFINRNNLSFDLNGMPCEDVIFNLSCLMANAKVSLLSYVGYVYYRTHGTLLSRYKKTQLLGTKTASEAWKAYKASVTSAQDILGDIGEIDNRCELLFEWRNIWMDGSPYTLIKRWEWLKEHSVVGGGYEFIKMFIYVHLRRWLYIKPIRQWHIKRLYPTARYI